MDVVELIFVRPAPVVMFAPLGVIPDGLPRIPVEVEGTPHAFGQPSPDRSTAVHLTV